MKRLVLVGLLGLGIGLGLGLTPQMKNFQFEAGYAAAQADYMERPEMEAEINAKIEALFNR